MKNLLGRYTLEKRVGHGWLAIESFDRHGVHKDHGDEYGANPDREIENNGRHTATAMNTLCDQSPRERFRVFDQERQTFVFSD